MRTLIAGLRAVKETPLAAVPPTVASAVAALLVLLGAFPRNGASAPAGAAFPMDVFFDLKQSVAHAPGWLPFVLAVAGTIAARSALLGATLWLAEGRPGSPLKAWAAAARLTALGALWLLPAAVMYFVGTAIRYAPFIWIAAAFAFFPALALARRAAGLDVGGGAPEGAGVPEAAPYLAYAYVIAILGASMSVLEDVGAWAVALVLAAAAPLHALMVLGWRSHLRAGSYPGGGALAVAVTTVVLMGLLGATLFDRYVREPSIVAGSSNGSLVILGGVDSTCDTGALSEFDPRYIGMARQRATALSYAEGGDCYGAEDTRTDLGRTARVVSEQVASAREPAVLLGHSQAALIVDRILAAGLPGPDVSVQLAPPPPRPPSVDVPAPGSSGRGRVGTDLARAVAGILDLAGATPFDIDAPNSPARVEPVVVDDADVPRLAVWALGDSVWLDGDWRRPGELNVVALTDHVGVARHGRSLDVMRRFLAGGAVEGDDASWRGALAVTLRYAFEPWRPR